MAQCHGETTATATGRYPLLVPYQSPPPPMSLARLAIHRLAVSLFLRRASTPGLSGTENFHNLFLRPQPPGSSFRCHTDSLAKAFPNDLPRPQDAGTVTWRSSDTVRDDVASELLGL